MYTKNGNSVQFLIYLHTYTTAQRPNDNISNNNQLEKGNIRNGKLSDHCFLKRYTAIELRSHVVSFPNEERAVMLNNQILSHVAITDEARRLPPLHPVPWQNYVSV